MSNALEISQQPELFLGRHHLMGTTRMADNEEDGVVDTDLKVFGSKNIYVLGGSVFPSGGAANPTLTIVALGMRLSEHIIQNLV
jgi:choline dehydrogenase-like flavoprotein